jgi:hypothetical protein
MFMGAKTARWVAAVASGFNGRRVNAPCHRNINPRHLVLEPNDINQGRKLCFQYMDELLFQWSVGVFGSPGWNDQEMRRFLLNSNQACALIHARQRCDCCVELWTE